MYKVKAEKRIFQKHANQIRRRPTKKALKDPMTIFGLPDEKPKTLKEKKLWKQRTSNQRDSDNHNGRRYHLNAQEDSEGRQRDSGLKKDCIEGQVLCVIRIALALQRYFIETVCD